MMSKKSVTKDKKKAGKRRFIYFSFINDGQSSGDIEIFNYIYDKMNLVAKAYGLYVVWRLNPLFVKRLSEEAPVSLAFPKVRWNKAECRRLLKKAELAVVDTIREAEEALECGKEPILMYNGKIPGKYRCALDGVFISGGFEGILKETQKRLLHLNKKTPANGYLTPLLFDCPQAVESNDICETVRCDKALDKKVKNENKELLLLWEQYHGYRDKIAELRRRERYDELLLIFDRLKGIIRKCPETGSEDGWDSDIIAGFYEVMELQGEQL